MVQELIAEATAGGIFLFVDGEKLGFELAADVFPADLKEKIIANKADIITFLKSANVSKAANVQVKIKARKGSESVVPASFSQQRLWFINQLDKSSGQYNIPLAFKVNGAFELTAAEQAITKIIARHQTLRTVFKEVNEQLMQIIVPGVEFSFSQENLMHLSGDEQEKALRAIANTERETGFDLTNDLMIRGTFVHLSDDDLNVTSALLLTVHHIACDGWSMAILTDEFIDLYQQFSTSITVVQAESIPLNCEPTKLTELPIQYADYVLWQQEYLVGDKLEQQLSYWQQQLLELPPTHSIKLDFSRPSQKLYQGDQVDQQLSVQLSKRLQQVANQQGVTLFMLLHGALALVISAHSNSNDIVIGAPVANRLQVELELLIGFFVNTLVLRVNTDIVSFGDYLSHVRQVNLEAQSNQDAPFEQLVDLCKAPRSMQHTPLFQIMFSMDNNATGDNDVSSLKFMPMVDEGTMAKFDIEVSANVDADGIIEFSWIYDVSIFNREHIEQLSRHLNQLLASIIIDPSANIADLPMLSTAEKTFLIDDLNQTIGDLSPNTSAQYLFEQQAKQYPDISAISDDKSTLTYAELNVKANQLARYLKTNGVQHSEVIGVCIDRSVEMVIALIAILKAGGTYVPLDPSYPTKRLSYVINDTKLRHIISSESVSSALNFSNQKVNVIDLEVLAQSLEALSGSNLPEDPNFHVNDLAYILYTSGSTGAPKGVMIPHIALNNFLQGMMGKITLAYESITNQNQQTWLAVTTIAFDIAGLEIFGPLSFGHKAVIASKKATMDPFLLMELIDKHNVNYMQATPATWRLLIDASWQGKKDITLLTGGEALPEDLANQLPLLCDTLWNCYGPTEATIWSMVRKVESVVLDPFDSQYVGSEDIEAGLADLDCSGLINTSSKSSIGGPLANYQHFILNKSQNLVPLGAIGELYIAGPSLAHGYFNRPDLTAINFIDVTLSGFDMRRLYRTGDLVRYLACGNMEFVGRVDEQVKIRGFRIELGEIESRLSKVEAISSCIVIVDESEQEKRLIAYVIQSETCQLTEDEFISIINQTLKNDLPDYMVPSAYVIMAKWPLTANGKVDKKALPKNNITVMDGKYQAPSSNTEKNLVKIWGALLKLDTKSISINANFFNVGGHSLLALRMISEIRAQLAIELSLADIFNYPELKSIATLIDNSERTSQFMRPAITAVDRKVLGKAFSENSHEISLSFAQRRLWFIDRVGGGSPEYNMPTAVVIEGDIDLIIVERALTEIIQRHEPLRTVFAERDGEPVQVIRDEIDFTLQQIDLRRLPKSEQETQLTKLLAENARCVFNLNQDLMLRATFFHLTAENQQAKGVLQFNMHHIASDGWSLGLVNKEFAELYQAFSAGLPSPLQPLTIQYADYAHWQQELLEGHLLTEQLAYWKTQLRDVPTVHSLPLDRPRKSNKGYVSQTLESTMPLKLSSMIKALATKNKLTLFMLLHSAFSLVLSRYSNNSDIVIGTPVANRLQAELEPIIGFFVNTLVLRTNNNHNTLAEFWQHIREVNLSAQANQDITFEHLIEHCNVVRSDSHTPLYQVMFNMNNNELDTFEIDGVLFSSMDDITDLNEESVDISDDLYRLMFDEEDISSNDRKFVEPDLFLTAVDTDRGIELIWKYDSTLFNCESIERLNTYLTTLLENIVEKPLAKLTEVSMLPHQEQQKILSEFNNTPVIYPGENVIHQRFESVVKKASDQIAVVFQQERLTYQQVNSSANQLAEWLRQQGVKNNDLVGINAKRSAKFVIAILAILKAGGAYVPIDPANPVARVGQMIEDAAIDILLTESDELLTINDFNPDIIKNVHCFCLDNDWDELASFNQDNVAISVNEDSIAYMIYTSGSTGTPKGALVHHGGALNHIDAEFELMGFSNSAGQLLPHNFLQSAASSSDISVWQFIAPLVSGGKVVVLDTVTDIPQMIHLIQSEQVHFIELAPSVLQVLIDYLNEGSEYKYKLPVLRWLMTTAEPISIDFINQWLAIFPNIPIINGYGPTEASDDISYYIIKEPIINDGQSVPIGKPIANMSLYVLDEQQALVPVGCIGEICVSGKGVGKGYWRKPEKTAESFVENPYADGHAHGKTLYRTGDLGCWLPDGNIEFIGRNDNQVKIRGFRIELGEIEAALLSLPEVKQSAVITSESSGGNILLAAYVVLTNDEKSQQALDIIKTTLALHLPHYMLPSIYTILPEMPLSLANKIDRKKLPKPTALDKKQHYHGAVTDTECVLVSIWAQLLSINESDISTNADFFELGGHSLLAVKLITRVFQIKEVQLPVKVLFTHSTIFKLAKYIDESHSLADKVIRYSLTTLTANTKLPYVFLAPAMGMLSLSYKNLALALKEECNLSILTTPGIDELIVADSNLLHFSLSQRVEQWLEAVIEQQPSGHYRLIGHSFGGSIVFELANKLEALGNTVSIVFVESVLASSNFTEQSNLMNYFLPMSKSRKVNKNSLHKMLREFGLTPEKMEPEHFKLYTQATTTQAEIFYSYQPQVKIIGKTQLVFAAQGLGDYENKVEIIEHIQDWCVQNVSVTATPGDHLSVLKEPEFIFKIQEILFNKP